MFGRRMAALLCFLGLASSSALRLAPGAEQNAAKPPAVAPQADSGWVVGKPAIVIKTEAQPAGPQQRIVLDQLLHPSKGPLLQATPTPAPTTQEGPRKSEARLADRNDGVVGWRPANVVSAPPAGSAAQSVEVRPAPGAAPAAATELRKIEGPHKSEANSSANAPEIRGPTLEFRKPSTLVSPTTPEASRSDGDDCSGSPDGPRATPADKRPATPLPSATALPELRPGNDAAVGAVNSEHSSATSLGDAFNVTPDERNEAAQSEATQPAKSVDGEAPGRANQTQPSSAPRTVPVATTPPPPLTPQLKSLRTRVRSVLKGYFQKPLNSQDHDPWEVMHGMLAYGVHSRLRQGGERGDFITSVGWLCYNRPCKGQTLLYVTPEGELRAKQGVGLQGHMGQLLAMLAQCRVSEEYPIRVGDREFTIRDLIEAEKRTCYPKTELTFKLIAFSHYLDLDETWVNDQGLEWDMPRLIREELAQPIRGAACGGTHRLSGLSLAVKARRKSGELVDGEYARAAEFVKNYQNYAFRLQNKDGSLSTKWFQGPGDESDTDRRVKTTGHILEWLIYSLSDEELRDQRTIKSVTYLANLLYSNYSHEWEVGPVSHAIHALLLYDERVFQPFDTAPGQSIASGSNKPMATGARGGPARRE
jgi:hypothetical protein